jgi:hypothetical protein
MPDWSMSAMRASMSQLPGRISSYRSGCMHHSALGRPTQESMP